MDGRRRRYWVKNAEEGSNKYCYVGSRPGVGKLVWIRKGRSGEGEEWYAAVR